MPASFPERVRARRALGLIFSADAAIIVSLFALNLIAIAPFLTMDFSSLPWNNDYTYIGMTRMFRDRPWSWNSLQYGGAPFHYLYPPLFHLMVLAMPVASLGRAYHLASGISYALVPVAFYVAAAQLFRSRRLAALLALVQSFSPTVFYYVLPSFGVFARDYRHGPWNFVAMIAANESAHTLSLALTLFVAAAVWRNRWTLAGLLAAAVFLTNWAGIIGLLMVLAALAVARSRDLGLFQAAWRVLGVAAIGYGLAAFWISPDAIYTTKLLDRVMLRHLQPSTAWNLITGIVLAGAAAMIAAGLWRRVHPAAAFALALAAIAGAVVIAYNLTGNYMLPLPHRYAQEFNAGLVLLIGCLSAIAWKWRRPAGALVLALSALPAAPFILGAWTVQGRGIDPRTTSAYQISDWLARHAGSARVLTAGELEGTLNIWADVPQVGGSAQGISNYLIPAAQREITMGCGVPEAPALVAELWLRALNVQYLVVHGARSTEHFHWFAQPERYATWPVAWSNGADTIYRVPPPDARQAVVVDLKAMPRPGDLRSTDNVRFLETYVAWARGKRDVDFRWTAPDRAEWHADLATDEAVLIKSNYDAGWQASAGTVASDPIGFLLIKGPARGGFTLRFGAAWPQWLGRALTAATILLLLMPAPVWITSAVVLLPALAAYGALQLHTSPQVTVAEQTYRRTLAPIISAGGIVDSSNYTQPPIPRGHIVSIFGSGFGGAADTVRVWFDTQQGEILYRDAGLMNVRMPGGLPAMADITIEVNGCRGNSFAVGIR